MFFPFRYQVLLCFLWSVQVCNMCLMAVTLLWCDSCTSSLKRAINHGELVRHEKCHLDPKVLAGVV